MCLSVSGRLRLRRSYERTLSKQLLSRRAHHTTQAVALATFRTRRPLSGQGARICYRSVMRFTQDLTSSVNVVRGYAPRELRVNDDSFVNTVILGASVVRTESAIASVADLRDEHVTRIMTLEPELVILGTGIDQEFPPPSFGAQFLTAGIGFEVMDTGAACRTFNVLVSEQRRVVALLIL